MYNSRRADLRELLGWDPRGPPAGEWGPRRDMWFRPESYFENMTIGEVYEKYGREGVELSKTQRELSDECELRGLPKSGAKAKLLDRLVPVLAKRKALIKQVDKQPKKARPAGSRPALIVTFKLNGRIAGEFEIPTTLTMEAAFNQVLELIRWDDMHLWYLHIPRIGKVQSALSLGVLDEDVKVTNADKITVDELKAVQGDVWHGVHDFGDGNRISFLVKEHDAETTSTKVVKKKTGVVMPQYNLPEEDEDDEGDADDDESEGA